MIAGYCVCVCDMDDEGRLTLCTDSLKFSEPLCSLLCVLMRSLTSSNKEKYLGGRSSLRALSHVESGINFFKREWGLYIIIHFIIWLAPRAGKMTQIARCDWLPERARWSHVYSARKISPKAI